MALEQAGEHADAIEAYLAAAAIDDKFAELRFRLARCFLATGDRSMARQHFVAAGDLDALRFRADTRINHSIRQVADKAKDEVTLVDVVATMADTDRVADGIVGNELFHEHVHLNFEGNYLLASAVFEELIPALPESIRRDRTSPPTVPSRRLCAARLAFGDWAQAQLKQQILDMTSEPPFTGQLDHNIAQRDRKRIVAALAGRLALPEASRNTRNMLAAAIERSPDDLELARLMASLCSQSGDHTAASQQWRQLLRRIPNCALWQIELGTSLVKQGKPGESMEWFKRGMNALPGNLTGHVNMGIALMQSGDMTRAIDHFRRVLAVEPNHFMARSNLGVAMLNMGRADEAATHLRQALELDASSAGSHYNMGLALLAIDKPDDAAASFRHALKLNANHVGARKGLADARSRTGDKPSP